MSKLQEQLDEILRQKQSLLKPENIRKGITAYGVNGEMTTENMWLPIYASEGNYYLLSFVNRDGNFNVKTIDGYGGFRIVTFNGDDRTYLFDVRTNKPKQISDKLPTTGKNFLLGYNDSNVYIYNHLERGYDMSKNLIYKVPIDMSDIQQLANTLPNFASNGVDEDYIIHPCNFYFIYIYNAYNKYIYMYKFNTETEKFEKLSSVISNEVIVPYMATRNVYVQQIKNVIFYIASNYVVRYNIDTDKFYAFDNINRMINDSNFLLYLYGITDNYCIMATNNKSNTFLYRYDIDNLKNMTYIKDLSLEANGGTECVWITNKLFLFFGTLYSFDEENLTFTKVLDQTLTAPQLSTTFKDIMIGYTFLGKNYYFNTGNSIIKDKDIIAGHYARDQYNQKIVGTMPELGDITIEPSIEAQSLTNAGHINSITVKPVTHEIDEDIKPENIRYGVNILGIAGSLEQDAAESVMTQEEYDSCVSLADSILGTDTTTNS